MSKKVLSIIESGYRATLEEQDDTIVWLTHAMKGAGANLDVLLRGSAVNYAVKGQDASGLAFGEKRQTQPPRLEEDLAKLVGKGVKVFIVQEHLADRGVDASELIPGVEVISRASVPSLFAAYDQVWHW
jgi:sulfur relay (sulfurtransferase) DsrF/TusC family protein